MGMNSQAYEAGHAAYNAGEDADENPHYTSFSDLTQDYYDWNAGWNAAEDSYYEQLDQRESEDWQQCLAEGFDD